MDQEIITRENTTLGIKLAVVEMNQGMLEKLLDELKDKTDLPIGKYFGEIVRAAIKTGWLVEPAWSVEAVGQQKPAVIHWMGKVLDQLYAEMTDVGPYFAEINKVLREPVSFPEKPAKDKTGG